MSTPSPDMYCWRCDECYAYYDQHQTPEWCRKHRGEEPDAPKQGVQDLQARKIMSSILQASQPHPMFQVDERRVREFDKAVSIYTKYHVEVELADRTYAHYPAQSRRGMHPYSVIPMRPQYRGSKHGGILRRARDKLNIELRCCQLEPADFRRADDYAQDQALKELGPCWCRSCEENR